MCRERRDNSHYYGTFVLRKELEANPEYKLRIPVCEVFMFSPVCLFSREPTWSNYVIGTSYDSVLFFVSCVSGL